MNALRTWFLVVVVLVTRVAYTSTVIVGVNPRLILTDITPRSVGT